MSTLLDENSIVVAYDHKRGEKRGFLHRNQSPAERTAQGYGDCIDCHQCVVVCPTGIDIRNGTQMECVHCTACIDACDAVMDRIQRPRGLVRYASLFGIERGERRLRVTPRLVGYTVLLMILVGIESYLVFTRADVQAALLRTPGSLYQERADGRIANVYQARLLNKTNQDLKVELRLEDRPGSITFATAQVVVPANQSFEAPALIELDRAQLEGAATPVVVGVYDSTGRRLHRVKTGFIGPREAGSSTR
jgi:cytochrome c oxidase accessory protein FixG